MSKNPNSPPSSEGRPFPDAVLGEHSAKDTVREIVERHLTSGSAEPLRDHVNGQLAIILPGLELMYPKGKVGEFEDRARLELEIQIQDRHAR